jgi:hypothetical protein
MSFDMDTSHMISPLDPTNHDRYNELVNEDVKISIIDNIYNITWNKEDYLNLIVGLFISVYSSIGLEAFLWLIQILI